MDNILLNERKDKIKIIDFGLSNFWSSGAAMQTHCGSPEYAAPELFVTNMPYGPAVDYWSVYVGIIMYGMVCGELPFVVRRRSHLSCADRRSILHNQISRGLMPSHHLFLSRFTADFRNLIKKLLTPNPKKRITLHEFITHPWLTCHGRRRLHVEGYEDLNANRTKLIKSDMRKMLNIGGTEIDDALYNQPYGETGGYFNILAARSIRKSGTGRPSTAPARNVTLQELATGRESSTQQKPKTRPSTSIVPQHTAARAALRKSKVAEGKQSNESNSKEKQATSGREVSQCVTNRPQSVPYRVQHPGGEEPARHSAVPRSKSPPILISNRIAQTINKYMIKQCTWAQQLAKLKEPGRILLTE